MSIIDKSGGAMNRGELITEIQACLEQLPDESLITIREYIESLLSAGAADDEGDPSGLPGAGKNSKISPDHPGVTNLAQEMGLTPDEFLRNLGEYERELLTGYIDNDDTGMLINLRRALGLPLFR
jgi:hypothetical protein